MSSQQKLKREELLKHLGVSEDILSLYEQELGLYAEAGSIGLEDFTEEDSKLLQIFHKLHESGLTYNEISLLASFCKILKDVDLNEMGGIDSLLKISPVYRLKQALNLTRKELDDLRSKTQELEKVLDEAISVGKNTSLLESELETKQKAINSLDKKLSDVQVLKGRLEAKISMYKEGKDIPSRVKGKKSKELYMTIVQKDQEIADVKKKNEELLVNLQTQKDETTELIARLELMENGVLEMEHELEERYQEQIDGLRGQIESLVDRKQKEWDSYHIQSSEQHKKEILTLQKKHEQDIIRLKSKIREQIKELDDIKARQNPLVGLLKLGEKLR